MLINLYRSVCPKVTDASVGIKVLAGMTGHEGSLSELGANSTSSVPIEGLRNSAVRAV